MAPVDSLADAHSTKSSAFSTFVTAIKDQAANLSETLAVVDERTFSRGMEALLRARRIFILGSGSSHHVAAHLDEGLTLYLDANVIFASSRGRAGESDSAYYERRDGRSCSGYLAPAVFPRHR